MCRTVAATTPESVVAAEATDELHPDSARVAAAVEAAARPATQPGARPGCAFCPMFPMIGHDLGETPFGAIEAVVSTTLGFGLYAILFT